MPGIGAPVAISSGPPPQAWTVINDFAGGSSLIYQGLAPSFQPTTTIGISGATAANPIVVTTTANHGLSSGQTIVISGATGNSTAANGIQVVTVLTANTFSIPVNGVGFTGLGSLSATTNAPLTTQNIWSIQKNFYDGASHLTGSFWAGGSVGPNVWDNRASFNYY